jgi:hypothetical protein
MPTSTRPTLEEGSTQGPSSPTSLTFPEPTYPMSGIFVQEGVNKTSSVFTLPLNFTDSFLIRGKTLSQYLRKLPNTTKFCFVGKYNFTVGSDKFLILSAKPKSFTDLVNKTTEFYLQVEPSNDASNQNDCLIYNLTNSLFQNASNPSAYFSLSQLCTNCSSAVTSTGLRLYFTNGEEVPTVSVSSLILNISGSTATSGNACAESTVCKARGFDCCLDGQCVTDGAIKPGALTSPEFLAAQEDVSSNPTRFVVYPQFYFVCANRPDSNPTNGNNSTIDPIYEANIRLLELNQLYNCINKVDGEFSHCTIKYTQANEKMPGEFSLSASGFKDDINFSTVNPNFNSGDYVNNIVKIIYAGQTFYEQGKTSLTNGTFTSGTSNDDLTSGQSVNLNFPLPSNSRDANLYITYKIDGTCDKLSTTLAKCSKTYVHASSETSSTTWHDSSKFYALPSYADTSSSASLIVKISGVVVPEDTTTWSKSESPKGISFVNSYAIYQNQVIEITYFVKTNVNELTKLKTAAQTQVNSICTCSGTSKCNLKPLLDPNTNTITNYECTYPTAVSTEPPVNQTVYVSNKNIAHRYFDTSGVNYDENYGSALDQEMTPFGYTNNDVLKPTNLNQYTGFNEIYGSFAKTGTYVARPAKLVRVKKDKIYDILVSSGAFSSCTTCGSDYYTNLQKIFPQNFAGQGGGYTPDIYENRRENNTSIYRGDDLLFGRACFVPATMIPWTHSSSGTPRDQRRARLAAQHFLFANGYNRDWYGFDYGSMIGSFDGVSWFSIGSSRRIKSTTGKLFLAVNAYVGDLNIDNNFNVTVSEASAFSSDIADHDTETDGAQCQKSHFCSNDNDCFTQLGFEYTCQNVASLSTKWPLFDSNASEIVGNNVRTLLSLVGGANGQTKRCVYRGRGAPCLKDLSLAADPNSTHFNSSTVVGHLMCSNNTTCVNLTTTSRFNEKISRFATTPLAQNLALATSTLSDTVGLGARIILRPFDYYGNSSVPATAQSALNQNNVSAICIPGRDVTNSLGTYDSHSRHPGNRTDSSDKIFGVGSVSASTNSTKSLLYCPATDSTGKNLQQYDLPTNDTVLNTQTIVQNMSSNLLNLSPLTSLNIYSSTNGSQITKIGYQRNTCLRAPGASCFSDMECAPSAFIAAKARSSNLISVLNSAEVKFWEEELVCGNPEFKNIATGVFNTQFDPKKNKCCREFGNTLSVYTQTPSSTFQWCDNTTSTVKVAGYNQNLNSNSRYSRVHTVYDKMTCDRTQITPTKTFALSIVADSSTNRMKQILEQYKTLDTLNQRTCCTNHWVRSFSTDNGGGHAFSASKMQNIDKAMFKHISWNKDNTTLFPADPDAPFECGSLNYDDSSCEIKHLTPAEEELYLTWAGSLELIGIPQVAIKTNDQVYQLVDDNQKDDVTAPSTISYSAERHPLKDSNQNKIMKDVAIEGEDFLDTSNKKYYSAASYTKMNMPTNALKKIFSEDEFNCCIPSGQQVPDGTTNSQCCTGQAFTKDNIRRCCLADFTDVTLYLNRYVSSEGRGLADTAYDPQTGYIKDVGQVQLIAAQKNLCCSGVAMTGVAISNLNIPLTGGTYMPPDTETTTKRFNYRTDEVDNNGPTGSVGTIFDFGVRWNNHVYCVPTGFGQSP